MYAWGQRKPYTAISEASATGQSRNKATHSFWSATADKPTLVKGQGNFTFGHFELNQNLEVGQRSIEFLMNRGKIQLDRDTEARLQGVRKELWWGGLQGLIVGTAVGVLGHTFAGKLAPIQAKKMNRNTLLATILLTGSIGSFVGAITYGRNAVQYVGDIFRRNSNPTSMYQTRMNQNEQSIISSLDDAYKNREDAIRRTVQDRDNKW